MPELKRLGQEPSTTQVIANNVTAAKDVAVETIKPIKEYAGGKEMPVGVKVLLSIVVIALGVGTGYGVNAYMTKSGGPVGSTRDQSALKGGIKVGDVFGVEGDTSEFTDIAEGVVEKGGIEGEGSHKLLRPGGEDQTAYLTSSVVDLDQFTGHKVKIWGKTFAALKAGWLLDVGRVQVLELNASVPTE